jgi:hypothetical protein
LKPLAWALLFLLARGALAAEVYRFVDADGLVVYSDRPTGAEGEEQITVSVSAAAPRRASTAPAAVAEDSAAALARLTAELPREPTPDEVAADRARNCELARQKNETYSTSHRLYESLPNGERRYLTSEQIDEARAKAAADVAAWCD